jgi:hypothetical protein
LRPFRPKQAPVSRRTHKPLQPSAQAHTACCTAYCARQIGGPGEPPSRAGLRLTDDATAKEGLPDRLPLVIGATGHRDLRAEDVPRLEQMVGDVIDRLKRDYLRGDADTPIIVLSSLAEGADRLIARIAMHRGAKLIAPLPMEAEEYRRDFEHGLKPDAAAEFDRLKAQAIAAPVMRFAAGNSREIVQREESKRALQYREVGIFIVRHCHVLIALWDGDDRAPAVGGTAEVVSFKRDGIPLEVTGSARLSLDAAEIGPVIHVGTPRVETGGDIIAKTVHPWGRSLVKSHRGGLLRRGWRRVARFVDAVIGKDLAGRSEPIDGERLKERRALKSWETFAVQIELTRRFNRDAARLTRSTGDSARVNDNLGDLFDDSATTISAEPAKQRAMALVPHWCALYQIADTLAQRWRWRFKWDWRILFGLGLAALVSFEALTHLVFDFDWPWLLGVYSAMFVGVFGWFFHARLHEHQERFLDYRALAEALRVAVFWKLVGIGWPHEGGLASPARSTLDLSSGDSVADAYPIRQPSELNWVKTCLRTLELLDAGKSADEVGHDIETDGHAWARNFWVHGQLAFFSRRGPRHERDADRLLNRSFILVIASAALATLLCLADYDLLGSALHGTHEAWPHRIGIFFIGFLPGIAAVWAGYAERLALEAQARQYDRMRTLFARAHDLLQSGQAESFRQVQALYGELGAEAMKESAEWVAIYRQRPLRPP